MAASNTPPIIRQITSQISTISLPFERFNRIAFGMRTTIVRLPSGSLAVFSPSPLSPAVSEHIQSLGNNVQYLIAPDIEHHIHLSAWKRAFPAASILAPYGLQEKRIKSNQNDTGPFAHIYKREDFQAGVPRTQAAKWGNLVGQAELDSQFDVEFVHAHGNREIVFLHKPDGGTLIEADMVFNLPATEQFSNTNPHRNPSAGILTKLALLALGDPSKGEAKGQRRFNWYLTGSSDRKAFAQSVAMIDNWQFERIIPCHGDLIDTNAKASWSNVFRWFLDLKV
jgi:hypothetical protein